MISGDGRLSRARAATSGGPSVGSASHLTKAETAPALAISSEASARWAICARHTAACSLASALPCGEEREEEAGQPGMRGEWVGGSAVDERAGAQWRSGKIRSGVSRGRSHLGEEQDERVDTLRQLDRDRILADGRQAGEDGCRMLLCDGRELASLQRLDERLDAARLDDRLARGRVRDGEQRAQCVPGIGKS